jgi:non-canonical poly(A) RNA polymerase PAPD5/7
MEHLALVRGPSKSILGPIIAANFEKYTEQRNQLRRVFMAEKRFAGHRVPPPPPLEPYHVSGVHSAPPSLPVGPPLIRTPVTSVQRTINNARKSKDARAEPEDISDEYSSDTKLVKPRKARVGRHARRWRAARMKCLRPDLKNLPSSITVKQALWHGGYATNGEMKRDLSSRERSQAAI